MIVVDTGPLYAVADSTDAHHAASVALLDAADEPLIVPITVIVETSFLIERHLGPRAEAAFLGALNTSRLTIDRLTDDDFERIAELVSTYYDLPLGAVDASVVAIAERLGITTIATVDRRHFNIVRPAHRDRVLPPAPRGRPDRAAPSRDDRLHPTRSARLHSTADQPERHRHRHVHVQPLRRDDRPHRTRQHPA